MKKKRTMTRRRAIFAGLTSAGALLLSSCVKKAPPTYGSILRMGDDLTYMAQRGLLSQRALAMEYQKSEITSFPVTDIGDPADPAVAATRLVFQSRAGFRHRLDLARDLIAKLKKRLGVGLHLWGSLFGYR